VANAFTDVDAFFESGIDAVAITSPAPCHILNISQAADYGKHVLCEKPLAMNETECRTIIDTADAAGIQVYTGFDYRFSPAALKIRDLVANRAVGDVLSLRLIYIWHCHGKYQTGKDGLPHENERRKGRMLEGGPLVDCGVHQIDLARFWLQSDVEHWTAAAAWVDEYEAPDHVYLHMDHENGAHSMVEISFSYCHTAAEPVNQFVYELIGTDGLIRYDRNAKCFEMRNRAETVEFPFAPEKNFAGMYEAFAEALASGHSDVLPTAYDGLAAAKISREATDLLIESRRRES
jgi:predicted dehydrogenase